MKVKEIPTPMFRQNEMTKCVCCSPPRKTLITFDPLGKEQYTCPVTKQTMRNVVFRCLQGKNCYNYRLNGYCNGHSTYLQGGLVIL